MCENDEVDCAHTLDTNITVSNMDSKEMAPCRVNVASEYGRLRAVLLHRPGVEIERMTPMNAADALFNDILVRYNADKEYNNFRGVLEHWTRVYYVADILEQLLQDAEVRNELANDVIQQWAADEVVKAGESGDAAFAKHLAKILIEGYEDPLWDRVSPNRYLLKPLYNLFFTRDASSTVFDRVLINSMSFEVRERETQIYKAIFRYFFKVEMLDTQAWDPAARTEGGDVLVASPDLLCVGQGIRTNPKGVEYLIKTFARDRERFNILVQELPHHPESFIHLDMVFTFLGQHECMAFEPMLRKKGFFADKATTLITIDHGKVSYREVPNILDGLHSLGWDIEPVICGCDDPWIQLREQWHSGANFFALGDGKVLGYRRNVHTIDTLDRAGFAVLPAEDICSGKVSLNEYEKFVAVFGASELPRAGGGARCMTMPILRD